MKSAEILRYASNVLTISRIMAEDFFSSKV